MILERKDIDPKYKWDLSVIYSTEEDFYKDYSECEKMVRDYKKHEKTMLNGAEELEAAIVDLLAIDRKIEKLWMYAHLHFCVDTADNNAQGMSVRVRNLAMEAGNSSWFVSPYLLRLSEEQLEKWICELPALESYRRMLEKNMRSKPHTLSDECEQLMSRMDEALGGSSEVRSIFADADLRFGKIRNEEGKSVELTDTNYIPFVMSKDRRTRQSAFRTLYKTYGQFQNTFATLLSSHIKERCTVAKARKYKNSITASTFRDEVTPVIYNNLIKSVRKGLPVLHGYYDLKREVLGLDKLHLYDVYAPLVGEVDRNYTYEEAVEEVLKATEVLGKEYTDTLRAGLTERGWVDVYPTRGKRGGAFSSGTPDTEPYILLNYAGKLDDVSTLAHEAGHSMHTYFSTRYNEPHNSSYTIFVAEVASTVNELLMAHRMLNEARNDDERLYVLNQLMETYKGTLFRQTMFAEFERDMHALCEKGQPLTADVINSYYYKLNCRYFGPRVAKDKQISYEWMRIPHFYTSFYVYKYATCISAATAIVKRIETEGAAYVNKYIDFLKCGGSRSPLDSLLVAGIDMTSSEVVDGALRDFESCIKQFREIYKNKIN